MVDDRRTFVIGDVHGCVDEVDRLLEFVAPGASDTVCFLGDYVDRGPSARGVIDRLIRLRTEGPKCVFLKGNHEDMFLGFLGLGGRHGDSFLWNGGDMTLASYGIDERLGHLVLERLPETHRQFLLDLETYRCLGAFLCVHAGVRPTRSLEDQMEEDLFWIREDFILNEHPLPYTVLYGHTPNQGVRLDLPHKIGLDTGLVYGNLLSCLELRDRELLQIQRGGRDVRRRSLAEDFARAGVGVA